MIGIVIATEDVPAVVTAKDDQGHGSGDAAADHAIEIAASVPSDEIAPTVAMAVTGETEAVEVVIVETDTRASSATTAAAVRVEA